MVDILFEKQNMFCEKCLLIHFSSRWMKIEQVLGAIRFFSGKTIFRSLFDLFKNIAGGFKYPISYKYSFRTVESCILYLQDGAF